MNPIPLVTFGDLLRRYRLAAGLTQEALAERTGLGVRSIQHLEGGTHLPHRETLDRLLRALGLGDEERSRLQGAAQPAPRQRPTPSPPVAEAPDDRGRPPAARHNLPAQLTSFVGRERELVEVRQILGSTRLLTLTGVGGTGKTRLALRVASELVGAYPDGIWLVDLAALADPALVPQAVAGAVGVSEQHDEPILATLLRVLRDRALLLLLDNCEHLIDACAHLAEALLRGCPGVCILATSREALGIAGEVAWSVPCLPVPTADWRPDDTDVSGAALGEFAAIRLFVERARAADRSFEVTRRNAAAIARICRRVDGLPLAIELAAARARVFAVQRIAAGLDDAFGLLTGGSRTALPRQQALKATIDWSYDLLSVPERALFRRLSVFAGGCTYEAIEGVCVGEGVDAPNVPDLLTRLVDKSLVQVEKWEGEERYRLLETIRQYGRDRLAEAGEADALRDRHRDCFLQFAERAKPELIGPDQVFWLDRLEAEHDNLRAALEWTLERGPAILGLLLVGAVWRLWHLRDYLSEGTEWLARALAAPGASAPTLSRAAALEGACELSFRHDDGLAVPALAADMLAIYRAAGDRRGIAEAIRLLATRARNEGDYARAEEMGGEALAQARESGDFWVVAQALATLAGAAQERGDHTLARRRSEETVAIMRELGDRRAVGWELEGLGRSAAEQGEYGAARAYLEEALAIARELRSNYRISRSLLELGGLARLEDDYGRCRALLEECLALTRQSGHRWKTGVALFSLGSLARAEGDLRRAETLLRESLTIFWDLGVAEDAAGTVGLCGVLAIRCGLHRRGARLLGTVNPQYLRRPLLFPDDRRCYEEAVSAARTALGDETFAEAWAEGRAMTLEQAVAYALEGVGAPTWL